MAKIPTVGNFQDDEERELVNAIESGNYELGESLLTHTRLKDLQSAARSTINEERIKVSLRVPKSDLMRLKAQALKDGMPYQTLINSILHKAVS